MDKDLLKMYEYNNEYRYGEIDDIDHPKHYTHGDIEVISVIDDWQLSYCLGNAVKYIGRCEHKGNKMKDIQKAIWYLEHELKKVV